MSRTFRLLLAGVVAATVLSLAGCTRIINALKARDQLNKGVTAYKSAQFNEAIEHFKTAVDLQPDFVNAKLYLAAAYQNQFIPGATSEDNLKIGQQAIQVYESILASNPSPPSKANAIAGLASIYYGMGDFQKAKDYDEQRIKLEPNNPEPYYSIGSIDWTLSYKQRMTARTKDGIADQLQPFVDPKKHPDKQTIQDCQDTAQQLNPLIGEGMDDLNKALTLRPDYSDAMQYLNLLYREKADLECGNQEAMQADLKQADIWVNKAIEARKAEDAKAAKAAH
jgi:tetratricopeptide (TPR) repeat protein